MSLQQRLAKLEQTQFGHDGAGVCGVMRVDQRTQIGTDVVTVSRTGETLTAAAFHARYPRGVLIERVHFGDDRHAGLRTV